MSVTPTGHTPPQAIDRITTQPLLTSDDRVPDSITSGDGYSPPATAQAVSPGTISQALQGGNTNLANQKPQPQQTAQPQTGTQQHLTVSNQPVTQGQALTAPSNQNSNVSVVPGEPKPVVNNTVNAGANGTVLGGIPSSPHGAFNNVGNNGSASAWFSAVSLAQSSMSQNFSSAFNSTFVTLYLSQPDTLREAFSHAVRRSNGHDNHHPTHQQQPSQLVANVFNQLTQQNRLALTSSPSNTRGATGPTELLNEVDRVALTRMVAASMRDYSARAAAGSMNHMEMQSLHPQTILAAYGLMHADQLGPDWLAHGVTQLIALAQGAGPQEADVILEALALALILSSLTILVAPNGSRSESALAQTFAAMQLIGQMQDPDAFAQMFSRLGSAERLQLLTLLATLSPNAKLGGLDKMDSIALLFKAFAARSGDARPGDAQRSGIPGADANGTLGTLLGARGAMGARGDTLATERLRAELLQFVATQPASFYYAEAGNKKSFHSGRLEAVLQLIVQQLLRELAAKAGRLSRLRCDFADSIELLSTLLDLLTQRDDEDSEHSHDHQGAEEDDKDAPHTDDAINPLHAKAHFAASQKWAPSNAGLTAEFACQTLFHVVPDAKTPGKIAFRWENFGKNAIADLPRQLAPGSVVVNELQQLQDYARAAAVVPALATAAAAEPSYELLSELLMPTDAAYALGATAAGATIMARHWHCKMWAHDLTYRLNADGSKAPFDFAGYAHQQTIADDTMDRAAAATIAALPRAETAMRYDLLRMLENSQDRWVREQASQALAAGLQKLKNNDHTTVESKGEVVRSLRSPMLRDATIYFLSRYYFKLNTESPQPAKLASL